MARKTLVVLEDDLTGQELPDGGGETVAFSIDGTGYEIDLSHENSRVMRETFGLYVKHARRIGLGRLCRVAVPHHHVAGDDDRRRHHPRHRRVHESGAGARQGCGQAR